MKSQLTTLCYIECQDKYLMLHRTTKANDENHNKWIGVGGHFENSESPEECLLREVKEETGLTLTSYKFRGIVTFVFDNKPAEYMCLYTADGFTGTLTECNEGELAWINKSKILELELWEGDKIFLKQLLSGNDDAPFFSLKLVYNADEVLIATELNGKKHTE